MNLSLNNIKDNFLVVKWHIILLNNSYFLQNDMNENDKVNKISGV